MYEKPTAPASIGGVLDSGFKLLRACFTQVAGLAILASFVSQMPSMALASTIDADGVPQFGSSLAIAVLLSMLISLIFYGAIVGRIHGVHRGSELTIGESFALGFSCMVPLLFCMLLYGLAIAGGSLLLLIPGVILSISLLFAPYILVVERAGIIESLRLSHKLVWGYWWRTAALVSIAGFIMMVAYVLVGIVAGLAMVMDAGSASTGVSLVEALVTAVIGGLVTPLFYALTMAAYYDLKLRRGGEDLAERINAEPVPA